MFSLLLKAIARVHRQISEETPQLSGDITSGLTTQLQVSTAQVSIMICLIPFHLDHTYILMYTIGFHSMYY